MAGPWFMVLEDGSDWKQIDTLWLSNGKRDGVGRLELRISLTKPKPARKKKR